MTTLLYTTTEMEVSLRLRALLKVVLAPNVGPVLPEELDPLLLPLLSLLPLPLALLLDDVIWALTPRAWLVAWLKLSMDAHTFTEHLLDNPWLTVGEEGEMAVG